MQYLLAVALFLVCVPLSATTVEDQVKLQVKDQSSFATLAAQDHLADYQMTLIGIYEYTDYYFDTDDLLLERLGYSFRFRLRDKGETWEYALQLKQEYSDGDANDSFRLELDQAVKPSDAKRAVAGDLSFLLKTYNKSAPMQKLADLLQSHGAQIKQLRPLIQGTQKRTRLRLQQNQKVYFEVSLDDCRFARFNEERTLNLTQIEFENKFDAGGGAMDNRVQRIERLVQVFGELAGAVQIRDSKYRLAAQALLAPPASLR